MKIFHILIKITTCKRVKYLVDLKNNESPDCYNVLKPTTITQAPVSVIISLLSTLYLWWCRGYVKSWLLKKKLCICVWIVKIHL